MKKIIIFALIAAICSSCLRTLEEEGVYDTITYTGRLVDKTTLQPISGVAVQITNGKNVQSSMVTSNDGKFSLQVELVDINSDYYLQLSGNIHYPLKKGKLVGFGKQYYDYTDILLESIDVVTTVSATMIDETTLRLQGCVNESVEYSERGFLYGTTSNLGIGTSSTTQVIVEKNTLRTFEKDITGITITDLNLYVCAYIISQDGEVICGEIIMIKHPYYDLPTFKHSGILYRVYPDFGSKMTWQQAMDACANLTYGGYSDWILPSKEVLNTMYMNKNNIAGFCDSNGWTRDAYYWSSTEYDVDNAWYQDFSDGSQGWWEYLTSSSSVLIPSKSNTFRVRCVRKED